MGVLLSMCSTGALAFSSNKSMPSPTCTPTLTTTTNKQAQQQSLQIGLMKAAMIYKQEHADILLNDVIEYCDTINSKLLLINIKTPDEFLRAVAIDDDDDDAHCLNTQLHRMGEVGLSQNTIKNII